ncbi:uncharacterized protein [Macrobrachium rosenbergii]|uniref:uncharacterized protein n=1 Tax=Macrobrachium rosenbergii TaxID=79674 RepID=UPI0034D4C98D
MAPSAKGFIFTALLIFISAFVSVVSSLPSNPAGAERPDARASGDDAESETESYYFFSTSLPGEEAYLARGRSLEVEAKDTQNIFRTNNKNVGFGGQGKDATIKSSEIRGSDKVAAKEEGAGYEFTLVTQKVREVVSLDKWDDAGDTEDSELMVKDKEDDIKEAGSEKFKENDNEGVMKDMQDTKVDENKSSDDSREGDVVGGKLAEGEEAHTENKDEKIEVKEADNEEKYLEGEEQELELGENVKKEENVNADENYDEDIEYTESISQLPMESVTLTTEGLDEGNTTDIYDLNNDNLSDEEEAYILEDDEVYIEFENDEETREAVATSDEDEADDDLPRKRKKGNHKRKSTKRKRNKKKNKTANNFVLENGHQETFQEVIEDFNLTLIELNLERLATSSSREPRQNVVYLEDIPLDDPVNPPQIENMSLWQYFLNFISGDEPEPPPKAVIVEKRLDHPCDFLPGEYRGWIRNAQKKQVVVIGGGVAGLSALGTLNKLGLTDSILIEASNRLGGRVHTVRHAQWMVEEGAPRIQGEALNPLFQLAFEIGAVGGPEPAIDWEDDVITSDGDLQDSRTIRKGQRILEHLQHDQRERSALRYHERSLGDVYSRRFDEMWGPTVDEKDKQAWMYYIHQTISGKFGVNSWMNMAARDAASFRDLGRDIIWKGGMDKLVQHLLYDISSEQLRLLSPVCQVFWDRPEEDSPLVVLADGSSYRANYIISALPLGTLKDYHYRTFFPPLPRSFSNALMAVDAGVVNRISLGWDYSWWGPKPFSQQLLWKDYNFPREMEWMSNIVSIRSNPERPTQLEMEVFGDAAIAMENMSTEQVIAHLINFLRTTKREYTVPLPVFFHRSKWRQSHWSRGSYHSYMNMDAMNFHLNDRSALSPILANTRGKRSLFFSGEHTSTDRFGTVDGALLSGVRAARWVMDEHATQEKLFLVVNGERRRLLPLDDQKLKIDYYQYFKNPTSAYLGALEISEALEKEKEKIQEEKKKSQEERKASRKAAKEKRKQKKNNKSKTTHDKEHVTTGDEEPAPNGDEEPTSADSQQPDTQTNMPDTIQKRSRLGDSYPGELHHHNSMPSSHSAVPVTTTTLAITPNFHSFPVQTSSQVLSQPGPMFQSMMPSSAEHYMAGHDDEVPVVYLNPERHQANYNPAFNSDVNDEVSVVYLDGQALDSGENGHPSVVYVEGPLNSQLTSLVDALTMKKSNSHTLSSLPDERDSLPTTSKKRKKTRTKKKKEMAARVEEGKEEPKPATGEKDSVENGKGRSEPLRQNKKRKRNKKKGNKKKGKKKKRSNKKNGENKQQKRNHEDATNSRTHTSSLHSNSHNPYLPYPGGINDPYYLPYRGLHPMDHFSILSKSLMLEGMKEKANSASKEKKFLERKKLTSEENSESSEIATTIRTHFSESVASPASQTSESTRYPELAFSTSEQNKVYSNIPKQEKFELPGGHPLGSSGGQSLNGFQSPTQDFQSQQIQGLNNQQHQMFHPTMNQNPSQQNIHSSSYLNQQNYGNMHSAGQQMPPALYKGLISTHGQQNTPHLNFNSQLSGHSNSQSSLLPNQQHSPLPYALNNHENRFRQQSYNDGFPLGSDSGLKYGSFEGMTPHPDYSLQLNHPATQQQPFRGYMGINKENEPRDSVHLVNPPRNNDQDDTGDKADHTSNNSKIPEAITEEEESEIPSKTRSESRERDGNKSQEQSTKADAASRERKRNRKRPNRYPFHQGRNRNSFLNRQRYNRAPGQQPFIIIPESSQLLLGRNNYAEEKSPSASKEVKSSEVKVTTKKSETAKENVENGKNSKETQENTAAGTITEIYPETNTAKSVPQTEKYDVTRNVGLDPPFNPEPPVVNSNQYFQYPPHQNGYPVIPAHSHFPFFYPVPYYNHFMNNAASHAVPPPERPGAPKSLEVIDPVVNVTDNIDAVQESSSSAPRLEKQNDVQATILSPVPEVESNHNSRSFPGQMPQEEADTMNPEETDEITDIKEDEKYKEKNRKRKQKNRKRNENSKSRELRLSTFSEEPDTDLHNTAAEKDIPFNEDILQPFVENVSSETHPGFVKINTTSSEKTGVNNTDTGLSGASNITLVSEMHNSQER